MFMSPVPFSLASSFEMFKVSSSLNTNHRSTHLFKQAEISGYNYSRHYLNDQMSKHKTNVLNVRFKLEKTTENDIFRYTRIYKYVMYARVVI